MITYSSFPAGSNVYRSTRGCRRQYYQSLNNEESILGRSSICISGSSCGAARLSGAHRISTKRTMIFRNLHSLCITLHCGVYAATNTLLAFYSSLPPAGAVQCLTSNHRLAKSLNNRPSDDKRHRVTSKKPTEEKEQLRGRKREAAVSSNETPQTWKDAQIKN